MDTHGDMGRLPTSGEFEGPVVGSYPMLERGCVKPEAGYTRDGFAYTVDYYDADGELPAYVRVVVDGDPVDMLLSPAPTSITSSASTRPGLRPGCPRREVSMGRP